MLAVRGEVDAGIGALDHVRHVPDVFVRPPEAHENPRGAADTGHFFAPFGDPPEQRVEGKFGPAPAGKEQEDRGSQSLTHSQIVALKRNYSCDVAPPVLLVDDDLSLAQAMTQAIEHHGIPVEHCTTGEVAIELTRTKQYAVLIVDLILEQGISGIYVVNAVRQMPAGERPRIIMITGKNLENLRGVDRTVVTAVMLKPLDLDLFADYVLATYRHALNLTSEAGLGVAMPAPVRTYCGNCGYEITPWVADRPLAAFSNDTFDLWMDTPCINCGTVPRLAGGRSEWTADA